jgi:hypothetical protein
VYKGDVPKKAAFVARLKRGDLVGVVRFGGLGQGAESRDALAKVEIPVTVDWDVRSVETSGVSHDEDKEGMEKEERSVVAIKYPRRRSVHLEPVIRKRTE